ncbi:hypothetical protein A4H97_10800 [Niastella yeongjuensis]|uniref:Uncharacterized protein n=1 Tax=Niastella yeongjuensis TaxID=354355 RepID=A0A1V9EFE2_9BACT|nr:hypothetical protein [Niastella yeongjuensis]OQP44840.1 hypothetical protein A4H97_10800 [Niastella yeongjuensis]
MANASSVGLYELIWGDHGDEYSVPADKMAYYQGKLKGYMAAQLQGAGEMGIGGGAVLATGGAAAPLAAPVALHGLGVEATAIIQIEKTEEIISNLQAEYAYMSSFENGGEGGSNSSSETHNNAKFRELREKFIQEERSSISDKNGDLKAEVINNSDQIMNGNELDNEKLRELLTADGSNISDWNKMSYQIRQHLNPKGVGTSKESVIDIHYNYNKNTNKFFIYDYKSKLPGDYFKKTVSLPKE